MDFGQGACALGATTFGCNESVMLSTEDFSTTERHGICLGDWNNHLPNEDNLPDTPLAKA